jgi:hypothetical protein
MADKKGTGLNGVCNKTDYKRRIQCVFAAMAFHNVVTNAGRINVSQQHQRALAYYTGAIAAWKDNEGHLVINGKTIDWLTGVLFTSSDCVLLNDVC